MIDQSRNRDVARSIENATVFAFSAEAHLIESIFESCKFDLQSAAKDHLERDEIARRIAEAKISVLYDRAGADAEFRSAWAELESHGFVSLEREAAMLVFLIEFLSRSPFSARDEMLAALNRLASAASGLVAISPEASAHFRRAYERLSTR